MKLRNHDELQATFRSWLEKNSEMLLLQAKLEAGGLETEDRELFIKIAHELSGTAGTFGFQEISKIASKLDTYIADGGLDDDVFIDLAERIQRQIQKDLHQHA